MATVQRWTGMEAKALRLAMRQTNRAFAEFLGVEPRTVAKWEQRGETITLLPESQALLDTALARAPEEVQQRFHTSVNAKHGEPEPAAQSAAVGLSAETILIPARIDGREVFVPVNRRTLLQGGLGLAGLEGADATFGLPPLELFTGGREQRELRTTVPADAAMDVPWSRVDTLKLLDDWVNSGLVERRTFTAISGAALDAVAARYLNAEPGQLTSALEGGRVGHRLLEQIEQSVPLLQQLDDANGGGAHLSYVGAHFRAVALLLRQGDHAAKVERRLFAALADIGQLVGWMAFDAGQHGLAQRYFFTTLRAAKEAGYRSMAAHVFADLAFQAASREQSSDAVGLGEAAVNVAKSEPATVRASVATRLSYGYAVAGQLGNFERSYQAGLNALTERRDEDEPAWMYFLTPNHLDTQAGYALVHAATLSHDADDRKTARSLLNRGEQLLSTGAYDRPLDDSSQRRALFEGAWLAVAAASQGDLERACALGRQAVARTERVQSPRSMEVLRKLAGRLRWRAGNPHVAAFLPELDQALNRQVAAV